MILLSLFLRLYEVRSFLSMKLDLKYSLGLLFPLSVFFCRVALYDVNLLSIFAEFMLIGSRQKLSTLAVSPTITIYDELCHCLTKEAYHGKILRRNLELKSLTSSLYNKMNYF